MNPLLFQWLQRCLCYCCGGDILVPGVISATQRRAPLIFQETIIWIQLSIWNHCGLRGKCRTSCPWTCRKACSSLGYHPDGLVCAQGQVPELMYAVQTAVVQLHLHSVADFEAGAIPTLFRSSRRGQAITMGWLREPHSTRILFLVCRRAHVVVDCYRNKRLFMPELAVLSFLCFFIFSFFTQLSELYKTAGKRQLQWGSALKHSCFVPFLLMQTFHGLSTWITFRWCSRTIFARTHLIAALSTLCKVHSLHFHLTLNINYVWPKIAFIY